MSQHTGDRSESVVEPRKESPEEFRRRIALPYALFAFSLPTVALLGAIVWAVLR